MDAHFVEQAVEVAKRALDAGSAAALRFFRDGVRVERKPDRTPVTDADRASEAAILAVVRETFPDHGILSEEAGASNPSARVRWIVDPIDGTKGFTRGGAFWGPMIACEADGEVIAGAMALPAAGARYWAGRGLGAWRDGVRLSVSRVADLADATLSLGEISRMLEQPGLRALLEQVESVRCYGDLAGAAMVLDGRAEAWIEARVSPWDLAATKILAEEAGGRFTDFEGRPSFASGDGLLSNGRLHDTILAALRAR